MRKENKVMSRSLARVIASRWIHANQKHHSTRITKVIRWGEDGLSCPWIYNFPVLTDRVWLAYLPCLAGWLMSSTIIVIDDTTSEVVYFGSAHDEG